jgi:hypothetical protein
MSFSAHDRDVLRGLAARLAEHAAHPRNAQLTEQFRRHNRLEGTKPIVLIFPEGAWSETITPDMMQTEDEQARWVEWTLRSRIYHAEHFHDDAPINGEFGVPLSASWGGWGIQSKHIPSTEARGAWAFDPPLKDPDDAKRMTFPTFTVDAAATQRSLEAFTELFGDLIPVRVVKMQGFYCSLIGQLVDFRGLEQIMVDMLDRPEWVHEVMGFMAEGQSRLFDQMVAQDALELNNGNNYVGSGGLGITDELPGPGYAGTPRLTDLWAGAEAQELAAVSPGMLEEFVLPYQARLLNRFGLNCYGCCEDITHKLPAILRQLPRLRRVSVSPWTDIRVAAETLQDRYIYSWKPNPTAMVVTFDPDLIRRSVREVLDVARGCHVEMILKDTHTCEGRPERLAAWVDIAQEEIAAYAGV